MIFSVKGYAVYHCSSCEVRFVFPQPTQHLLSELYAPAEYYDGYGDYFGDMGRRSFFKNALETLEDVCHSPGRLLDVGCGPGLFMSIARSQGWDVQGVDPGKFAVDYASEKLKLSVRHGELLDQRLADRSFDVITMWDTIEHLRDPLDTLQEMYRLLRPGGFLLLTTGEVDDMYDRLLFALQKQRVCWYDPPQHLFFFSRTALTKNLLLAGFTAIRLGDLFSIRRNEARQLAIRRSLASLRFRARAATMPIEDTILRRDHRSIGIIVAACAQKPR